MLESIFRIAEATAKLRLKNTIDVDIALEVQESVQVMQTRLGQYVKTVQDPRDIAIEEIDKVVENIQARILFEEAVKVVVGENQRVRSWLLGGLNKKLNATHNKRFRELYDRYVQHIKQPNSKILILKMKPLTIVWQTAKSVTATAKTITASDINDLNDSNDLSNINNISENQPENGSDNSYQTSGVEITENQNLSKKEMRSFGSFGSFGNDPNSTDKVVTYTDNIAYEYLEQVKAYRCLQCRCIYYEDTKDSYESHPCNGLGKSKGVVN